MRREHVLDIVIGIVSAVTGRPAESLSPDTNLVTDVGADSIDLIEILMDVEDEFTLAVTDDEAEAMRTISDVVDYVYPRTLGRE